MEKIVNNTEKKPNIFKRFGGWYKKKYEEHPVGTVVVTGLVGTAIVGGGIAGGVAIYKACKPAADVAGDVIKDTGLPGIEPIAYDLPAELGFDCVKVVTGSGEVLADAADMGVDYIVADRFNIDNIKKVIDAATDVAEAASEVVVDTVIDA